MRYAFSWDPAKAQSNLAKHGVPFELALEVFRDPLLITKPDARYDGRWVTIGAVRDRLIVVVHTDVETTTNEGQICVQIRIISARRATPREREAYRGER